VDHPLASSLVAPAPAISTAVKTTSKSALLEAHVGAVVGAAAAALGAAVAESQDGKLTSMTKGQGGKSIYELFKLRQLMIGTFPNFDVLARQCGVETLLACNVPPEAANMLVDSVLELLGRIVRYQLN